MYVKHASLLKRRTDNNCWSKCPHKLPPQSFPVSCSARRGFRTGVILFQTLFGEKSPFMDLFSRSSGYVSAEAPAHSPNASGAQRVSRPANVPLLAQSCDKLSGAS